MASNNSSTQKSVGIGFSGLLTLIFITLKLTHVIDWSWVWVLGPIWIPVVVVIAIAIIVGILTS